MDIVFYLPYVIIYLRFFWIVVLSLKYIEILNGILICPLQLQPSQGREEVASVAWFLYVIQN